MSAEAKGIEKDLISRAERFRHVLDAAREQHPIDGAGWYPFNSLKNVEHLHRLLGGTRYELPALLDRGPVLDVGCADGELAFFLESLGATVTAVDHPDTNYNGMRGVRELKRLLNSPLEIRQMDIDQHFDLGQDRFGLVCLLGILYHLKNPFAVLEKLSRHAQYCLLSTRVARFLPDGKTRIADAPVAYLLDDLELNSDRTNFWIFSEAGLRRLLSRTQWSAVEFMTIGSGISDPHTIENDERAYALLRSRYAVFDAVDLLSGWHRLEQSGWRWTKQRFEAKAYTEKVGLVLIELDFVVHEALLKQSDSVVLACRVNASELPSETYTEPGRYVFTRTVEIPKSPATLAFELSHAIPPGIEDRELGLIVTDLRVSPA